MHVMQTNKCKHVQQSSRAWFHHTFTWFYCRGEKPSLLPQAEESEPVWRTWLPAINRSQHVYCINLHVLSHLKIALGVNSRCTFTKVPLTRTHACTHMHHESPSGSCNGPARLHQACLWPICRERERERRKIWHQLHIYMILIKCLVLRLDKRVNPAMGQCFKGPTRFGKHLWTSRFYPLHHFLYWSRLPEKEITWAGPLLQPQPVMRSQDWKIFT